MSSAATAVGDASHSVGRTRCAERRLFTLNIGGPSLERAGRIANYLLQQDLDVIVLTETRPNAGTAALVQALRAEGYEAAWPVPPTAGERGVALLCRAATTSMLTRRSVGYGHRLVMETVALPSPMRVIAAYVPSRDASPHKIARKRNFVHDLVDALREASNRHRAVLIGDFNVVSRDHVPRYSAFRGWEYELFDKINDLGFSDAFSLLHPGIQAYSWIGRTGGGYRYDYAFISDDIIETAIGCVYVHEVREERLSDHAGLLLTLAADSRQTPKACVRSMAAMSEV